MSSSQQPPLIPVILAGGSGNRLWPLSRQEYPKQLIALLGERSLIQDTALRYGDRARFGAPLVIANDAIRFTVAEQLQSVGVTPMALVLEPVGRGTAPAVAVAALLAMENDPDAVIIVAPSDHAILDVPALHRAIATAVQAAQAGHLVTFSIPPSRPETGYGYIEHGPALGEAAGAFRVASFVEKPPLARAEAMLAGGTHFWNSGMFAFRAKDFLAELERFQPAIVAAVRAAVAGRGTDLDFVRLAAEPFAASPSDSIDYAVMEKTARAATVPLDAGWSDVGAWSELWAISRQDAAGNATRGDVVLEGAKNCLVVSDRRLTALVGVENLSVVVTDDAVLVSHLSAAQDVKRVVERLKEAGRNEVILHKVVHRPWGYYQNLHDGDGFQVKRLTVKPGARISLQKHFKRSEHWTVVEGTARVTRGDETFLLQANESTYIPLGTAHRLENGGDTPMTLIEVQCGSYLGEDDILRLDDAYGRAGEAAAPRRKQA
ncbi:MAG TPA: mannose-1-phosphate guanylyltransferase/mannose-6-phosphate isomerase [Dongiaceae bacterium]|jgi:mannose-1-phosphate guanylyltransferase/mannose-1-phosphate guanylyltransferase/mannose-6-phosphate isomerase|nr:mannose-1-phosphate guanylyltransferase/mannose-6-phosphate isomerase [Dongiaceae bacterium]